ncbi:hypothetical protein V6N13_000752 [Hibiscus sabdariffa]|uniref:Late embryogenesis abundant protein LEA-2 subgroup domain-containing protein n=1 Tax=Hibiscus sabdariffa TaxID=183260 RepID=A0ABR2G709_9ROSI
MPNPDSSSIAVMDITLSSSSQPQLPNLAPRPTRFLFVRRLIQTIVLLFVFINVVYFVAWLVLNPTPPAFQVNSFNISTNANYTIAFTVGNPNRKLSLLLDRFQVLVFQGKRKAVGSLESMLLAADESLCLNKNPVEFRVHGRVLKNAGFLGNQRELASNFNVKVNFRTKFLASNWFSKRDFMAVYCKDLAAVRFSSEKRKCSVRVD